MKYSLKKAISIVFLERKRIMRECFEEMLIDCMALEKKTFCVSMFS